MKKVFILSAAMLFLVSCICTTGKKTAENYDSRTLVVSDDHAVAGGGFLNLSSAWAKYQTEVRARSLDDGLEVEFICHGAPENTVYSAKKADDDMALFGGEHIEMQLSPNGLKDKVYYHFAVNPAGSLYHAKCQDTTWTPEKFTYKITDFKDHRKIVLHVAWQTLGLKGKPASGTVWRANFCRASKMKDSPVDFASWSGAQSFHDLNYMGKLVFADDKIIPSLLVEKCDIKGDFISVSVRASDKNKYEFQLLCNGVVQYSGQIADGKSIDFAAKLQNDYVPLKNKYTILMRMLQNNCIVWEKSGYVDRGGKEFMLLDKFEYILNSDLKCEVASVPGNFVVRDDDKILLQQKISTKPAVISLKGLTQGRYIAEYSSGHKTSSRVFFISDKAPGGMQPMEKNAKVTADGADLFFGGKPFYLLGISGGSKTYFPYHPGFTLRYGAGGRAYSPGYQWFPGKKFVRKPAIGYAFHYNWEDIVSRYLQKEKQANSNNWRSICYEANLNIFTTQKDGSLKLEKDGWKIFHKMYQMAKKTMPDTLFTIHIDNPAKIDAYVNSCDAMEFATWSSSYHASDLLLHQSKDLDFVRLHIGNKPVIMWLGGSIPNPHCRSAEELRGGIYQTIILGGAGNIIHMGHGGIPASRTRFWSMLSMIQREIKGFYADLKNGTPCQLELPSDFVGVAVRTRDNTKLFVILNKSAYMRTLKLNEKTYIFTPFEARVIRHKCN